jgi:RNA polymerase sigma-70 factor (ECF subfamily)
VSPIADHRSVVYCIVPESLAAELHDPLREHFRNDPTVHVVVEQRGRERRKVEDRRGMRAPVPEEGDRRRVRAQTGRRVAQRRASVVPTEPPALPDFAAPHLELLQFVERLEPSTIEQEDADTGRLVARLQAGERDSFNTLYLRYFDRVYAYLSIALQDAHEAEDATQEVFIRVMQALPGYERRTVPFRAWLFRIVRNDAINRIRQRRRLTPEDPDEVVRMTERTGDMPAPDSLDWLDDQQMLALIEQLPLAQRQVIVLRYMLELRAVEIATVLDRSPEAIRQLHQRAMRFLRQRLAERSQAEGTTSRRVRPKAMTRLPRHSPVIRARKHVWA